MARALDKHNSSSQTLTCYRLDLMVASSAANRLVDPPFQAADPRPGQLRGALPFNATNVNSGNNQIIAATWIALSTPVKGCSMNSLKISGPTPFARSV
jgi:hypothetical protein